VCGLGWNSVAAMIPTAMKLTTTGWRSAVPRSPMTAAASKSAAIS
jgi:hypothetical protein